MIFKFSNLQIVTSLGVLRRIGKFINIASSGIISGSHLSPGGVTIVTGYDLLTHIGSCLFSFFLHFLKILGGCSCSHT